MDNPWEKFINLRQNMDDRSFLAAVIAYRIAPTMVRKKPASLIAFPRNLTNQYALWEKYKDEVAQMLDMKFIELRKTAASILVLFYHEDALKNMLLKQENRIFLKNYGYGRETDVSQYLEYLQYRFSFGFPHEIGIFLGIPLEDVQGFIENKGKDYLLNKYWKVYHNKENAKRIFYSYDRAKRDVMSFLKEQHFHLTNLA